MPEFLAKVFVWAMGAIVFGYLGIVLPWQIIYSGIKLLRAGEKRKGIKKICEGVAITLMVCSPFVGIALAVSGVVAVEVWATILAIPFAGMLVYIITSIFKKE